MNFPDALAYANRIYLANRSEFEYGGVIPTFSGEMQHPLAVPDDGAEKQLGQEPQPQQENNLPPRPPSSRSISLITTDGRTIPSFKRKRDPRFKWKHH